MKNFRKVIAITLLLISFVYNQVNTEAIRGNNLLPGIHHNLELDFAYISGNTDPINYLKYLSCRISSIISLN